MAGLGLLFAFMPLAKKLSNMQRSRQKAALEKTAVRTTHINETVTGIKMIKMYAWSELEADKRDRCQSEEVLRFTKHHDWMSRSVNPFFDGPL